MSLCFNLPQIGAVRLSASNVSMKSHSVLQLLGSKIADTLNNEKKVEKNYVNILSVSFVTKFDISATSKRKK